METHRTHLEALGPSRPRTQALACPREADGETSGNLRPPSIRPVLPPLTTHGLRLTCTTTHGTSVTRPQSDRRPARSSSHDSSQRGGCARLTRPRPGWRLTRRPPQGRGRARAHARQRTHAGEALPPPPPAPYACTRGTCVACSVGAPHLDFRDQRDEPRRFCASTLFQPLLRARLPVKKVSCAARRHPVSPAQRKKNLSSAQEAHFACENASWRRTLEALLEGGQAGRRHRDKP